MGIGYSRFTVRPAQFLNFFPTTAVMILIGGQSLATIDSLVGDGIQTLSVTWWIIIVSLYILYIIIIIILRILLKRDAKTGYDLKSSLPSSAAYPSIHPSIHLRNHYTHLSYVLLIYRMRVLLWYFLYYLI